jgi:hypothetical protein
MDDSDEDQRMPHQQKPNAPASVSDIRKLGVLSWNLDADKFEDDATLEAIRKVLLSPFLSAPPTVWKVDR